MAKCSVVGLPPTELIPFNRLRSRSIVTLPFRRSFFEMYQLACRKFSVLIALHSFLSCSQETAVAAGRNRYGLGLT